MAGRLALCALALGFAAAAHAAMPNALAVPPDTLHWSLEGQAGPAEFQAAAACTSTAARRFSRT